MIQHTQLVLHGDRMMEAMILPTDGWVEDSKIFDHLRRRGGYKVKSDLHSKMKVKQKPAVAEVGQYAGKLCPQQYVNMKYKD